MRAIVESPLAGDTVKNLRYALWCCRYLWETRGIHAIASHMICPWFMDDSIHSERDDGIDWEWVWEPSVTHWFFEDLGWSNGMSMALMKCNEIGILTNKVTINTRDGGSWPAFCRGEWPPHTAGFEIASGK